MLRHIVMFKLADTSKENIEYTLGMLRSMEGKIEGMLSLEAGANFLEADRNYDIALVCEFDSLESFQKYQTHPVHMPVRAHMHKVRTASVACDYYL
ncbi:MAG: Dabb family protein [Clostridiales bacterium]|nr:Dabb family protein [Clostridiales bacterium]MBQ2816803.1 Dabb family protein [Clostridia bacterium]